MDHGVINRPESVEIKILFVPRSSCLHFQVWLVTNAVIDEIELDRRHDLIELFLEMMSSKTRQEWTCIVNSLDKCMDSITIGLNARDYNRAIVILKSLRSTDALCSSLDSFVVDACRVID